MGNILNKEEEKSNKKGPPQPPSLSEGQLFALKEQFVECWSTQDVREWLRVNSLSEYADFCENTLVLDGDGLLHIGHTILFLESQIKKIIFTEDSTDGESSSSKTNTGGNNGGKNGGESSKKAEKASSLAHLQKYDLELLEKVKQVNEAKSAQLVASIKGLVQKYEGQFGPFSEKDEKFTPYVYPTFENGDPKRRPGLIMFYHKKTQHTVSGGSRSVERRWFSQPRIYRRYYGAPYVKLPLPPPHTTPYNSLFFGPPSDSPLPISTESISEFFYYSLSVTGRRDLWTLTSSPRSAWVKRANPSSGGLHPIECYVILPRSALSPDSDSAVFHYSVQRHALERRRTFKGDDLWKQLNLPPDSFLIGISSINWREVWKYGERGFRYSLLDAGHALGSLSIAAAKSGWKLSLLPNLETSVLENLIGISHSNQFVANPEKERGLALAVVSARGKDLSSFSETDINVIDAVWEGSPNHLSGDHLLWEIVNIVDSVTIVEKTDVKSSNSQENVPTEISHGNSEKFAPENLAKLSAEKTCEQVIATRRSALDYVDKPINLDQFVHILYSISRSEAVYNLSWSPLAHLFIFAYQVNDLTPGLYVFVRNNSELEELKEATKEAGFEWTIPPEINLPLYFLKAVPKQELSALSYEASCHQHIASTGSFSLGMFVNLEKVMEKVGPNGYCRAHFECGALGQILYLEAHALGLGATGMGCYLDDEARRAFGLQESGFWSLYHFAVGVPSKDDRYAPYDYTSNMFEGVLDECVACVKPK